MGADGDQKETCGEKPGGVVIEGQGSPSGGFKMESRKGRERQRYSNGMRLIAGCIPVREVNMGGSGPSSLEVCMITARAGDGKLIFPKGGWELDETVDAAAQRETWEEAGICGDLERELGQFAFSSKRDMRKGRGGGSGDCLCYVFIMRVKEILDEWPEMMTRQREWLALEDAISRCRHGWMKGALRQWGDEVKSGMYNA